MTEGECLLLKELARVKQENRRLRKRMKNLEQSRAMWRERARVWTVSPEIRHRARKGEGKRQRRIFTEGVGCA